MEVGLVGVPLVELQEGLGKVVETAAAVVAGVGVVVAVAAMVVGKVEVEVEVLLEVDLVEPSLGALLVVEAVVEAAAAVVVQEVVQEEEEVAGEMEVLGVLVAVLEEPLVVLVLSGEGRLVEVMMALDSVLE